MSIFLQLAFLIAVILLAAKAAGYLSVRLGQPSVLGELLVGILLGPSLLNLLHLPFIEGEKLGETIKELGELGVLLLMFIAGLELHLDELTRNTKVSALAGIMGVLDARCAGNRNRSVVWLRDGKLRSFSDLRLAPPPSAFPPRR